MPVKGGCQALRGRFSLFGTCGLMLLPVGSRIVRKLRSRNSAVGLITGGDFLWTAANPNPCGHNRVVHMHLLSRQPQGTCAATRFQPRKGRSAGRTSRLLSANIFKRSRHGRNAIRRNHSAARYNPTTILSPPTLERRDFHWKIQNSPCLSIWKTAAQRLPRS